MNANNVVEYVSCTSAALTLAQKEAQAKAEQAAKVTEKVAEVLPTLTKHGFLSDGDVKTASSVLCDPVKALEFIRRMAEKAAQARLGTQTLTKAASVRNSLNSPYVGVRTSEPKESDRVFMERLGLAT